MIFSKISGINDAQKLLSFDMSDLERPDKSLFDQQRPACLHWVKLFSIILVSAIVLGLVFALRDYVRQYTAYSQFGKAAARAFVKLDTWDWFRRRFVTGACAGAAFSLLYMIQRYLRNRVP